MDEPDWMFMNPASVVFVTLCVIGYVFGALVTQRYPVGLARATPQRYLGPNTILLPLMVAFSLNLLSVLLIAKNTPDLFISWFINGADAKRDLDTTGALSLALPLLYALCWWSLWQILNRENVTNRRNVWLRSTLSVAFLAAITTAVIKVARYDMMPMTFGIALAYLVFKLGNKRVSTRKYLMFICSIALFIIIVFFLFSLLRGSDSRTGLFNNGMGYTAASYNRLAGVLSGEIRFPYRGTGTYTFDFISNLPILGRWTHFGLPDSTAVWRSEFYAVSSSGLDGGYNLISAFGYVYEDIGWASPLYFMMIGVLTMWSWRRMRTGHAIGLLLYPWMAFSVLYWFGNNVVARPQLIVIVGAAAVLSLYERVSAKRLQVQGTANTV